MEAARFRPQAVLSGHVTAGPAARLIGRFAGVPVIQYVHADELRMNRRMVRTGRGRGRGGRGERIRQRELAIDAGADPARTHTILNGVDLPDIRRADPADRPTLVTVARLEDEYKGHDVIVRALPIVREPRSRCRVAGGGGRVAAPGLEQLATEEGVRDAIRFWARSRMTSAMRRSTEPTCS